LLTRKADSVSKRQSVVVGRGGSKGPQGRNSGLPRIAPYVKKPRAKSKEQGPLFSSPPPNPALKGTRGYALACFPLVWSARAP